MSFAYKTCGNKNINHKKNFEGDFGPVKLKMKIKILSLNSDVTDAIEVILR
jgi:hypothetical protein